MNHPYHTHKPGPYHPYDRNGGTQYAHHTGPGDRNEPNYQGATKDFLVSEIRKQTRKRQYHFELFKRYRERIVNILLDTTKVIDWYDTKLSEAGGAPDESMSAIIKDFKQVISNESSCSVCHQVIRNEDLANCLIPRCAHPIHSFKHADGQAECCYARLKRDTGGGVCFCPICDEELPKNVHTV